LFVVSNHCRSYNAKENIRSFDLLKHKDTKNTFVIARRFFLLQKKSFFLLINQRKSIEFSFFTFVSDDPWYPLRRWSTRKAEQTIGETDSFGDIFRPKMGFSKSGWSSIEKRTETNPRWLQSGFEIAFAKCRCGLHHLHQLHHQQQQSSTKHQTALCGGERTNIFTFYYNTNIPKVWVFYLQ